MKRLLLTCTDLMAIQFLVPHVKYLSEHGFSVELPPGIALNHFRDQGKSAGCHSDQLPPDTAQRASSL